MRSDSEDVSDIPAESRDESQEEWLQIEEQFKWISDCVRRAANEAERNLFLRVMFEYLDLLLVRNDRIHEYHAFALVAHQFDAPVFTDANWAWIRKLAPDADETRRYRMVVALFDRNYEDDPKLPIVWDQYAHRMFEFWFEERTRWVLELAYLDHPERLVDDLKRFAERCASLCQIEPRGIE